jgi:hypothetical protein
MLDEIKIGNPTVVTAMRHSDNSYSLIWGDAWGQLAVTEESLARQIKFDHGVPMQYMRDRYGTIDGALEAVDFLRTKYGLGSICDNLGRDYVLIQTRVAPDGR